MLKNNCPVPYLPDGRVLEYISLDHPFMREAQNLAKNESLDQAHPTGAVIVKNGEIIGRGVNGSAYHTQYGCERKKQNIPTGTQYELCPGCAPSNHAEQKAIFDAKKHHQDLKGSDIFLYGHYWCCHSCWDAMISEGIEHVYLLCDAEKQFKKQMN